MNIGDKIEELKQKITETESARAMLINAHAEQINKVIEDKILALKEELRDSAIQEVCGEEYRVLNADIDKNNNYINMLENIEKLNETGEFMDVLKSIIPTTTESVVNLGENVDPVDLQGTDENKAEEITENASEDNIE